MKYYGVIESHQDYKGADATLWGVEKTIEAARNRMSEAAGEILSHKREEMSDDEWEAFFEEYAIGDPERTRDWYYEDDDLVVKRHIEDVDIDL